MCDVGHFGPRPLLRNRCSAISAELLLGYSGTGWCNYLCVNYSFLRWQSGFCEEGRSSNASQFARDADADAAAGTTAAAGRAAAPASGRIEPARREGADLTRPTGRPRRRAHVALSKPSATPLRLPSRRLPCSLLAQAIDS